MSSKKEAKEVFICQECGEISSKWLGKCGDCGAWNSFIKKEQSAHSIKSNDKAELKKLEFCNDEDIRTKTGTAEFDRVLGGGIVLGSAILVGGDPGIGKSTLLIQIASNLSKNGVKIAYISGEESISQISLRAKRLNIHRENIYIANNNNISEILNSVENNDYKLLIIDSIQTVFDTAISSSAGSVSQVRICTQELIEFAKKSGTALVIVSHVTKDGQIAGPKLLEHMVDTVLYFEGDRDGQFRILRTIKNRYGNSNEIGIFEMTSLGLEEVLNPSRSFLPMHDESVIGTSVFAGMEGTRPILVEIQALIAPSYIPSPRRAVVGWDTNRLAMMIAVLNSRVRLNLMDKEVYLNVAGGIKINETSADLGVAIALTSAFKGIAAPNNLVCIGEVSLTGEVRLVPYIDVRLNEAKKLGFNKAILPKAVKEMKFWKLLGKDFENSFEIYFISNIRELDRFFVKK